MSRNTWNLFLKEMTKALMDKAQNVGKVPLWDWHAFKRGVGVFAIIDEESQQTMKELIAVTSR